MDRRGVPDRLLVVVSSLAFGGAERVAATLSNEWARQGAAVTILVTYAGHRDVAFEFDPSVRIVFVADLVPGSGRRRVWQWLRKLAAVRDFVRAEPPEVIVSFLTNVNVTTLLATIGLGIPVVVSERSDPLANRSVSWSLRKVRAVVYRLAACVVTQTTRASRLMADELGDDFPIIAIPNPIPPLLLQVPVTEPRAREKVVVGLGRLAPEKAFHVLIWAFAKALAEDREWTLEIWGDGPERERLAAQIAKSGLEGRVLLRGSTSRPWDALSRAAVFVLTSDFEGFPNAMLEAMALGTACIAFDCPSGPREVSDDGRAAVLVNAGDQDALVREIVRLASDRDRYEQVARAGREFVLSRYAPTIVLQSWDDVFTRVGGASRRE
jgi:GalNAc-alpha-(1->4)-GalNAc-alpha-(1->3)-diNAcBac-PP-undecaprenol alpha-1,4-N-acetyl-D-galactosaminyltransferase